MSAEIDWRWADASGQQRLVRTDELRAALASGVIAPNTPVWRRGWKEWKPAYDVPELTSSALAAANGLISNIPPPPLAMVAVQRQFEGEPVAVRNKVETEPPAPPSYVPSPTRPAYGVFHTPSVPMQLHPQRSSHVPHAGPASGSVQNASSQNASSKNASSQNAGGGGSARVAPPVSKQTAGSQTSITETAIPDVAREANTAVNMTPLPEGDGAPGRMKAAARTVIGIPQIPNLAPHPAPHASAQHEPPPSTRRGGEDSVSGLDASRRSPVSGDRGSSIPGDFSRRSSIPGDPQYPSSAPIQIPTISLQGLTRSQTPPPPMSSRPPPPLPPKSAPQMSSRPPPPPSTRMKSAGLVKGPDPKTMTRGGPPRPTASKNGVPSSRKPGMPNGLNGKGMRSGKVDDDSIEELSGSILLPDQSGKHTAEGSGAYEELSGSMLLPDASAQVPTATSSAEELSGSFLLDAGSTGALPSVESTGAILAAARVTEPSPHALPHVGMPPAGTPTATLAVTHEHTSQDVAPHGYAAGNAWAGQARFERSAPETTAVDHAEARVTEPSAVPAQLAATTRSVPSIGSGTFAQNGHQASNAASAPSWASGSHAQADAAHAEPSQGDHARHATPPAVVPQVTPQVSQQVTAIERPSTRAYGAHGLHVGNHHYGPSQTGPLPALDPSVIPPPSPDVLAALSAIEASPALPPADPGSTAPHPALDANAAGQYVQSAPNGLPQANAGQLHHSTLVGFAPAPNAMAQGAIDGRNAYPAQPGPSQPQASMGAGGPTSVRPSSFEAGPRSDSNAPIPERSSARLHDMSLLRPDMRKKLMVPVLAGLGAIVLLGVIGLIVGAVRKKPSEIDSTEATASSASPASSSASLGATPATTASPIVPPPSPNAPPPVPNACVVGGAAHVIAPRAVVQSGVEVQQVGPSRVALGFASGPREGMAVAVDPTSLTATQTVRARAPDAIRRLVPFAAGRGLNAASDVDGKRDHLLGRRTIAADPPFDLGFAFGALAWAPYRTEKITSIWPLDGDAPIEAVRATPLDSANRDITNDAASWAITFRRGASIYAGVVVGGKTLSAKGPLVKIDGLGPQVGSPSVAANGDAVLVAWADRASASDPWGLRWMRFAPGDASGDPRLFTPPAGGLGDAAMSPTIAAAGLNRFVLAWTEGPVANHQVRAQTLSASGDAIGAPIAISGDGVNAGQAQMAILPDGRGVVAYLAAREPSGKTYEVMATPLTCP